MLTFQRRKFIKNTGFAALGLGMVPTLLSGCDSRKPAADTTEIISLDDPLFFKISLAQWSLHKSFFGDTLNGNWAAFGRALQSDPASLLQGPLHPMDFPAIARNTYDVDTIELVNTFYFDKAKDQAFLQNFKQRCEDAGVSCHLIMCDALGDLGNTNDTERAQAIENHLPWIEAAAFLGCKSIRVNAAGSGTADEVKAAAVDGLGRLSEEGAKANINIIVENHGGYSSDADWLADLMTQVNMENCGTLPDFGNFCIERENGVCIKEYDRYDGVKKLLPFAKGVSAKTHNFDENGLETNTDYAKMMGIIREANFDGIIGIEYEGNELSEEEGIKATKQLLQKFGTKQS